MLNRIIEEFVRVSSRLAAVAGLLLLSACVIPATDKTAQWRPGLEPPQNSEIFSPGDTLEIEFPDLPTVDPTAKLIKTQVKDDGRVTGLPLIPPVTASEKTVRELEEAIHAEYVPKYYRHLTVIARPGDRVYYVGGEVKQPDKKYYIAGVTVTKAIQTAGDFTDFANRKEVKLVRKNGKSFMVDYRKASKDAKWDPPVYPGDRIEVKKSLY